MAKFSVEYSIHLGDKVSFIVHRDGYEYVQFGIVQDISQMPDIFVEGFDNETRRYTRWKRDIMNLTMVDSKYDDAGKSHKWEFEKDEEVEFVHKGDPGTPEFDEIEYVDHKRIQITTKQ